MKEVTKRASVFEAEKQPLALKDVPQPEIGPGDVLMRVEACGVCFSDVHIVDGAPGPPGAPPIDRAG